MLLADDFRKLPPISWTSHHLALMIEQYVWDSRVPYQFPLKGFDVFVGIVCEKKIIGYPVLRLMARFYTISRRQEWRSRSHPPTTTMVIYRSFPFTSYVNSSVVCNSTSSRYTKMRNKNLEWFRCCFDERCKNIWWGWWQEVFHRGENPNFSATDKEKWRRRRRKGGILLRKLCLRAADD